MKIAIIDADLIGCHKHRFPNLACMKLSAYYKSLGYEVSLKTNYNDLNTYDKIYISKVFTSTIIPGEPSDQSKKDARNIWNWYQDNEFLKNPKIECGGTGFYYDNAPKLPDTVEHMMPDYHLYDEWVQDQLNHKANRKDFTYYLDYSIGFVTRGCFRQCSFCVNQNCKTCVEHSPIAEFYDVNRPKLCFLDDNFFACSNWHNIIASIKSVGKPFQFKQGLDERLLTDAKISELMTWNYDGDIIFAFDNIEDRALIEQKLHRIYELNPTWKKHLKFYVLCGYDRNEKWDQLFYQQDIYNTFERIKILSKYSALPYIMRYETCYTSEYAGIYSSIAGWCNQPNIFKKFSYRDYCRCKGMGNDYAIYKRDWQRYLSDKKRKGAAWRYMELLEHTFPEISPEYLDMVPETIAQYGADFWRQSCVTHQSN